jgi:abequosyltransferase
MPPLLTIAIPTYNRSENLALLLGTLAPQMADLPQVELLISDNASPDETEAVVRNFMAAGLQCRYIRNAQNIEADPNFLQCFEMAAGRYVWIFGDDDVILPGALARIVPLLQKGLYDLIFLTPMGFLNDPFERGNYNPQPRVRVVENPSRMVRMVGLRGDLILLSGMIVDKQRVEQFAHPDFRLGFHTNLLQVGWVLTALRHLKRGLVVEVGLYASCEQGARRGFDVISVFVENWERIARTFLPEGPLLQTVLDEQMYSWFTSNYMTLRVSPGMATLKDPLRRTRRLYGRRIAFWLFAWPVITWPVRLATVHQMGMRVVRRLDRMIDGWRVAAQD